MIEHEPMRRPPSRGPAQLSMLAGAVGVLGLLLWDVQGQLLQELPSVRAFGQCLIALGILLAVIAKVWHIVSIGSRLRRKNES